MGFESKIKTITLKDDCCEMIDQTILPYEYKVVNIRTSEEMFKAIKDMIVRGAPAIGIAGAHGVVLSAYHIIKNQSDINIDNFKEKLLNDANKLRSSRPTAVNLMWAIDKQIKIINDYKGYDPKELEKKLRENSIKLENDDIEINKKIGAYGKSLVPKGAGILTHCNAGALATVGYGTALGVIRSAFDDDKTIKVFANETRPRQQGSKLTTFELIEDGIDVTLLTDAMCSYFMQQGKIQMVVTGADRIARNGDTANKIGTYTIAICAKYHNIPFYIAAPLSTIDTTILNGQQIPIEIRNTEEITHINQKLICHPKTQVINPSFDITPYQLISGIITEIGVLTPNFEQKIINLNL